MLVAITTRNGHLAAASAPSTSFKPLIRKLDPHDKPKQLLVCHRQICTTVWTLDKITLKQCKITNNNGLLVSSHHVQ
jgi:hypothetical protein